MCGGYSSSLKSGLILFCSFLVWANAAPKAIPIPIPIPILPVAAPIPMPIATPAKNFNSLLIYQIYQSSYKQKMTSVLPVHLVLFRLFLRKSGK